MRKNTRTKNHVMEWRYHNAARYLCIMYAQSSRNWRSMRKFYEEVPRVRKSIKSTGEIDGNHLNKAAADIVCNLDHLSVTINDGRQWRHKPKSNIKSCSLTYKLKFIEQFYCTGRHNYYSAKWIRCYYTFSVVSDILEQLIQNDLFPCRH